MTKHTSMTGDDLIDWLQHQSGWKTRNVPGIEISLTSHLFHDVIDEIKRLATRLAVLEAAHVQMQASLDAAYAENERLRAGQKAVEKWLNPSHVRLHVGEMSAQEMRSVIAVVRAIAAEVQNY